VSRVTVRIAVSVSAAVAVVAIAAPAASAANIVPNPGFETDCAGDPCNWSANTSASIDRVTANPHSGAASMQITTTLSNSGALSDCVNTTASGTVNGSFWYRTADTDVTAVLMGVIFYTGAGCTGASTGSGAGQAPNRDDEWHQLVVGFVIPAGTSSVGFFLQHQCSPCDGATVFYDDVDFDPTPTAVTFGSFSATRSSKGVHVRWRTASELHTLGFNLYREQHGKLVRLNRRLIPSAFPDGARGHAYSWLDRSASMRTARRTYRLQEVGLNGKRSWVGTTAVLK
jgi:hypothetical protein